MSQQVIYVAKSSGLCGGIRVVLEHISHLRKRGYDAKMFYLQDTPDSWFREKIPANKFNSVAELQKALKQETGIKVATWFETAYWVSDCLASNDRGYYLVQDIEESYCVTAQHKEIANNTYKLGLKHLATSKWVSEQLASRFGLPSVPISLGLDFDTFKPVPDSKRDMFRVLTQCRVWSAGPNLKGWNTAKQAVEKAFELDRAISLVTFSIENKQKCRSDMAHIHIQRPDDKWLNELYNTSGLYLLSSNHEGFGLTAAEAMLVGTPVVCTLADGNSEFCIPGKTALTAEPGDYETLSKYILHLFHNQEYADSLAKQAQDFIKQYTWERSIDALEYEFFNKAKPISYADSNTLSFATSSLDTSIEYPVMPKVSITEDSPLASIVIPTVNDFEKTRDCIESIKKHTSVSNLEILVVDDGTQDQEILYQLQEYLSSLPFSKLLKNYQNLGFSASVNKGMRNSLGKYLILCNNDIRVTPNWLTEFIKSANSSEDVAIVGAKLLYPDNTIQHAGMSKIHNALSFPHIARYEQSHSINASFDKYVWAVTGALFLIKRQALEQLGGFSTAYATAWEDVDYCMHALTSNYKVLYSSNTIAYHSEGATRGATFAQKRQKPLIWMEREQSGERYFRKKWAGLLYKNKLENISK